MFEELKEINSRPLPFQYYTAEELWTNEHTAKQMVKFHLNETVNASSRNIKFIDRSVLWIAEHFKVDSTTEIADFGCGPGLYTTRLAEHGAQVTGIDFSQNSINYARKSAKEKGLKIKYAVKNYLDYKTAGKYDLIIMIMCDFCALSPEQRKILLAKFHKFLKPEGAILLDVYSLNTFNQKDESATYELNQLSGFWSPDDYYCFVNTFKYDKEKVLLDKYTICEETRNRVVYNWLQCFSQTDLIAEFKENGFQVSEIFSDVAGSEYTPESLEIAITALKSK